MNKIKLIILFLILFVFALTSKAQEGDFREQVSGYSVFNFNDPFLTSAGLRYIPDLKSSSKLGDNIILKTNLSFNAYASSLLYGLDSIETDFKIKAYRLQLGLSGEQFEIRFGLQKINFGSAALLRPLMWFDKIDPRDPLQLTDGVYGVLGRYYFLNNANIWLWSLFANKDTKGWEAFPSNKNRPEVGGRIQYPVLTGELAVTWK